MQRLRTVAASTAAALACAAAAGPVTAIYAPGPLPALLSATALVATAVTAGLRARFSATAALSLSLLVLAGGVVGLGLWLPRPDGSLLSAALDAVRYSGARILTTATPVPTSLETITLPVCGTWLAAATSVTLLCSRRPALAVLPPVALLVGAVGLVGPPRAPAYGYTVALAVALVALLALVEQRVYARMRGSATVGFTVLVAAIVMLVGPVLAAAGDRQPPDLRTQVEPPYLNPEQVNPLSLLPGWAAEPDTELMEVHTDRPAPLRWVALSEFTGITWVPPTHYQAAGAVLPSAPAPAAGTEPARHEVTNTGLQTGWLPAPPGAREVQGVRVAVDADSTTLVAPDTIHPGAQYTVDSQLPTWQEERLLEARLSTDAALDVNRELPAGRPGRLDEIARVAAGTGSPYQQASRLSSYLRENYRFDPRASGGNGYPSITRFLDRGAEDGGRGTSEQFATAFAVLARSLGIPSRVVVGFGPGERIGDDRYLVRTGDARAWVEVHLDGVGWVQFDPTPSRSEPDERDRPDPSDLAELFPPELPPSPEPSADPSASDDPDGPDPAATGRGDATPAAGSAPPSNPEWLGWLAIPIGVVAAVAAVAALRLRRSARRLRRGGPIGRVLGGWAEVRDGLRQAGWRPGAALTVDEVAGLAAAAGGVPVGPLAAAVNRAAFGGFTSPDTDVDATVAVVRSYRRALRRRAGRLRRLTWWVDPRPLWWR